MNAYEKHRDANAKHEDAIAKAAEDGDLAQLSTKLCTSNSRHFFVDRPVHRERCFTEWATALSEASRNGHLDCVQKLVEMGAGSMLENYKLAIENAAIGGHIECFRFLTVTRLFKSLSGIQKYNDFIDASTKGDFDRVLQLLEGNRDKDILTGWKGLCLMSLFIVCGCPQSCLEALIDQGVDVNRLDYNGLSPLMCAVLARNVTIVRFLLHLGVKVNRPSVNDEFDFLQDGTAVFQSYRMKSNSSRMTTALMYAASCSTECLHELLEFLSEEDVNCVNKMNRSALTYAAYYGNTESVSLLIKAGACVDLVDNLDHATFLYSFNISHCAMVARNADSLELLLQAASRDCIKYTTSNVAVCLHDLDCLRVLLKYAHNIDDIPYNEIHFHITLLMQAAAIGCVESVCLLLEHGAGVNVRNCYGETALMFCCHDSCENVLDLLIDKGAEVNIQNFEDNSVIMYMAINNSVNCLHKLISHGASIHVRNNNGETPLMLACLHGHNEFADVLIKLGADAKAQNKTGEKTILYAFRHSHEKCVELLLAAGAHLDVIDKQREKVLQLKLRSEEDFHWGHMVYCGNIYSCKAGLLDSDRDKISIFKRMTRNNVSVLESTSLAIKLGFFDWECCLRHPYDELDEFVSSAVFLGVCPARFNGKHPDEGIADYIRDSFQLSPLLMSFLQFDTVSLLKYILASRFFFPEDYKVLVGENSLSEYIWLTEHNSPGRGDFRHKLTREPMSLKTWSFLTVSKAVSLGGHPAGRPDRVDALPIPDSMKRALKFKTSISRLSPLYWDHLGIDEVFDSLNFREEITWRWDSSEEFDNGIFDECDKLLSKFTLRSNNQAVTRD